MGSKVITAALLILSAYSLGSGIDWSGINWKPPEHDVALAVEEAIAWRELGYIVITTIAIAPLALALAFYIYFRTKRGQTPLPWWRAILVGIVLMGIVGLFG